MLAKAPLRPCSGAGCQAQRSRPGPVGFAQRRGQGAGFNLVAVRPAKIIVAAAAGERRAVPEPTSTAAADGERLVNGSAFAGVY
ncbi:hypothetical protein PR202_gb13457 [Eleusine coracana subsp. coracana]|uniref:Uncharacterized protein n=1 Tax=Eleusine coracana subsp. coracana TaxID=191504 RepID=A0AAV5ESX2_ELECO|nr:hypothetical protein PR202_gb13457 [Eleusine coracana subsp. coracana]